MLKNVTKFFKYRLQIQFSYYYFFKFSHSLTIAERRATATCFQLIFFFSSLIVFEKTLYFSFFYLQRVIKACDTPKTLSGHKDNRFIILQQFMSNIKCISSDQITDLKAITNFSIIDFSLF